MSGFITLHRDAASHPLFEADMARYGAWVWLLSNAAWKDTPFNIKGKTVTIKRGQICISVRGLAGKWGWSKSSVSRFLTRLQTETMIEQKAGHGKNVITICNYDKYQLSKEGSRDSSGTASGTAAGQQRDTKEQVNNNTLAKAKDEGPSSDKMFWDSAKDYLGKSKSGMIGKWVSQHGKEETAKAITAAQLARAVDPVPYVQSVLNKSGKKAKEHAIC